MASVCLATCRTAADAYVGGLVGRGRVFSARVSRQTARGYAVAALPVVDEACGKAVVPKQAVVVAVSRKTMASVFALVAGNAASVAVGLSVSVTLCFVADAAGIPKRR